MSGVGKQHKAETELFRQPRGFLGRVDRHRDHFGSGRLYFGETGLQALQL
jgi:hypothetical protein